MENSTKGYIICFIGVFTWCFPEIIVKYLQGSIGPISLSFLRFLLGGLFLFVLLLAQKDTKDYGRLIKARPGLLILASMVALGISNILYFVGLQYTQANVGSALYTTYPIFISIYSIFILNERTNIPFKIIGYIIGFIGILILVTNFQLQMLFKLDSSTIFGNILLVSAGAIWGLNSVLGKYIMRDAKVKGIKNIELKYNMIAMLFACVPVFFFLITSKEWASFLQYTLLQWLLICVLGFISTGFGLFLFFIGLRKIEVSRGISLALLKPIIVTILAFLILHEIPTLALLVSICLVSVAVLFINRPIKKENIPK